MIFRDHTLHVRCDTCGKEEPLRDVPTGFLNDGHDMAVLSVRPKGKDRRIYLSFCGLECLRAFVIQQWEEYEQLKAEADE